MIRISSASLVVLLVAIILATFMSNIFTESASLASPSRAKSQSPFARFKEVLGGAKVHLIAGAVARGTAIFAAYPLDVLKTRQQIVSDTLLPPLNLNTLYNGIFSAMVGQVPFGALTFGMYEVLKEFLFEQYGDRVRAEVLVIAAAVTGDIFGSLYLVPLETIKTQIQRGLYDTSLGAIKGILLAQGGGISSLYAGYFAHICRDAPFRALQMLFFEIMKKEWLVSMAKGVENSSSELQPIGSKSAAYLNPIDSMLIGVLAGSLAAFLTVPLDVIRTRLMAQSGSTMTKSSFNLKTMGDGILFWLGELLRGRLFGGAGLRVAYVGPATGVFFIVYESIKKYLGS
jgi:solute carrier family 25 (mitochondrial S-adenosylmethionine transporter), member 26